MEEPNLANKMYQLKLTQEIDIAFDSKTPITNLHKMQGKIELAYELNLIKKVQFLKMMSIINKWLNNYIYPC